MNLLIMFVMPLGVGFLFGYFFGRAQHTADSVFVVPPTRPARRGKEWHKYTLTVILCGSTAGQEREVSVHLYAQRSNLGLYTLLEALQEVGPFGCFFLLRQRDSSTGKEDVIAVKRDAVLSYSYTQEAYAPAGAA